MAKKCSDCNTDMIDDCGVYGRDSVQVVKVGKGLFNNVSEHLNAYVCPSCGKVSFYVEDTTRFKNFIKE